MATHETQVPGTRSPPHGPSAAPALNRGKRCRCGILPDRKTALEHREDGEAGKRTTAPAPNRGKRCRCGILPDRKAALEHREDGAAGKRTTAPAPNRVKCCRCGGRMVVWGRMGNLPRSGMPPVTAEVALGEVSCYPGVFLTYITCISPLKID